MKMVGEGELEVVEIEMLELELVELEVVELEFEERVPFASMAELQNLIDKTDILLYYRLLR